MGTIISSYRQSGISETDCVLDTGGSFCQEIEVGDSNVWLQAIDIILKKTVAFVLPITFALGTIAWDDDIYTVEISSSIIESDGYCRVHIPVEQQLSASTGYAITVVGAVVGEVDYRTSAPIPSSDDIAFTTFRVKDTIGGITSYTDRCLTCELLDVIPGTVARPPVDRTDDGTYATRKEALLLQKLYPGYIPEDQRWIIDDHVLPVNPRAIKLTRHVSQSTNVTLDGRKIILTERCGDSPRIVTAHTIEAEWGPVGRDFVVWLQTMQEFSRTVYVEIRLMDTDQPEVCYTPEYDTDLYLKRYYGTLGNWKQDESTVTVYKNGEEQESGYTINYRLGYIQFDSELDEADVVQCSYIWRPLVRVSVIPNFNPAKEFVVAHPTITLTEVTDE